MRPEIKNLPFSGQPLGPESYKKYQEYQPHVSVSDAKKGAPNWSPRQTRDQKYRICPFQGYHLEPKAKKKYQEYQLHVSVGAPNWCSRQTRDQK